MDKNRTVVRLAGQEFKISSPDSPEYVQKVTQYVNRKIDEVQSAYPSLSTVNCILLAALNLGDELYKLQEDYDALDSRISQLRDMPRPVATPAPVKHPFENKKPVTTK